MDNSSYTNLELPDEAVGEGLLKIYQNINRYIIIKIQLCV